jgi:hypothetical protein
MSLAHYRCRVGLATFSLGRTLLACHGRNLAHISCLLSATFVRASFYAHNVCCDCTSLASLAESRSCCAGAAAASPSAAKKKRKTRMDSTDFAVVDDDEEDDADDDGAAAADDDDDSGI